MTAYFTRDDIQKINDIQFEEVAVPEWGDKVVRVRSLDGEERDDLEASMIKGKGKNTSMNLANLRAKLVSKSAVDESGKRIFSDEDVKWLGKKNAAALQRVFDVASRLSGISSQDVDELTKNSEEGPSADSGSD